MTEGERIARERLKAHLHEQTEDGPIFDQGIVEDLARRIDAALVAERERCALESCEPCQRGDRLFVADGLKPYHLSGLRPIRCPAAAIRALGPKEK